MAGGTYNINLKCKCGEVVNPIWFYVKGSANRVNYFVKCDKCNKRTHNRNKLKNAITDWEESKFRKY